MKTNYYLLFIVSAFLLSACSVGVNKDFLSGLKVSNSGLSYKDAYLSRAKVKLNSSEFSMGDTVYLYMGGIEGYTEKEGKVYVGASMVITDPEGKKLLDAADLFTDYDAVGASKEDMSVLSLRIIVTSPLVPGVKYNWKSRVWDKNGKGEINAEVEFTIK